MSPFYSTKQNCVFYSKRHKNFGSIIENECNYLPLYNDSTKIPTSILGIVTIRSNFQTQLCTTAI